MAVALVAAALSVSWAPPASAEHTGTRTVWYATLTAGSIGGANPGFDATSGVGTLSDRSFTYDGVDYSIVDLFFQPSDGSFNIGFDGGGQEALKQPELTLHVGNRQFALADAMVGGTALYWSNSGLSWEEGDTVRVWLTVDLSLIGPLPTMTASISGDPVEGGGAVTLTLTLSEPVDEETSMQRRVGGTAARYTPNPNPDPNNPQPGTPGDYDWIKIPTFAAGATTATTQIRAVQDNEVEGCETITWVMTMWPGTYRAVHTPYTIYIEDDDGGTPCSILKAQHGVPGARVLEAPTDYVVPGYTKPAGSPGSAGDGEAGLQPPGPEPGQAPEQAPSGTAGQAPDPPQGDGNHGNSGPPPSDALAQGEPEAPSEGTAGTETPPAPAEPTPEPTAEERLIAEIAGADGCVSQDERVAGATRVQNADLRYINQSEAYRMLRAAYC